MAFNFSFTHLSYHDLYTAHSVISDKSKETKKSKIESGDEVLVDARIMVVEDEAVVADDIRRSLQNMNYAVPAIASSGEEAIEKAHQYDPDLVLMDIVLKGEMDGIEAAKQIRSHLDVPLVYLTAYSDKKILERAKTTEPFGYLIKPFKERELGIAIEIALFKNKVERELKENKEWFSTTVQNIKDGVIAVDPKGYVKFMNPVAQSLTGWTLEETYGKSLKDVFNIINKDQILLISRNKNTIPIDVGNIPMRDHKGKINGNVLVFRDITERKQTEETLRCKEKQFQLLIENVSEIITVLYADGTIIYESPSIEQVLGYSPEELIGKNTFEFVHPEDLANFITTTINVIQNPGIIRSAEFRFRHKDGSWRIIESVSKNVINETGANQLIMNSRDITDGRVRMPVI